jgi:hypothetical protein
MNCPDCHEWLQRRLDGEMLEMPGVEEHMAGCLSCRQQYQAVRFLFEGLQNLKRPVPPEDLTQRILTSVLADRRARRRRMRLRLTTTFALAASLLVAALAGYLWLPPTKGDPDKEVARNTKPLEKNPPIARAADAPSLTQSVEQAGSAVMSFTERLADKGKQQAKVWWTAAPLDVAQALPDVKKLEQPLDPAAQSLRQTGQGMSESLQTVAQSARRAVAYFFRELPPLETPSKSGS